MMMTHRRSLLAATIPIYCLFFCMVLPLTTTVNGFQPRSPTHHHHHNNIFQKTTTKTTRSTTTTTRLFDEPPPPKTGGGASVRFSGADTGSTQTMNPLDTFLSYMSSDIASIALGAVGLLVIVLHRLSLLDETVDALPVQTRTDLLAVFACGSVLLNGITKLDVTAALSESVVLEGPTLPAPEILVSSNGSSSSSNNNEDDTISWVMTSLLTATPAKSVVLLQRSNTNNNNNNNNGESSSSWSVVARAGVVSSNVQVPEVTPILARVGSPGNTKETYLPTLQALPGKRELTYLPGNAQLALMIPIGDDDDDDSSQVLVLGGNTAKSFSPRDVAWSRIVAERIGQSL